jgi:hypothetical protein
VLELVEITCKSQVDYVTFFVRGKLYMLHYTNVIVGIKSMVNRKAWVEVIEICGGTIFNKICRLDI